MTAPGLLSADVECGGLLVLPALTQEGSAVFISAVRDRRYRKTRLQGVSARLSEILHQHQVAAHVHNLRQQGPSPVG